MTEIEFQTQLAILAKTQAELTKLVAEAPKLAAEQQKLMAERLKLERDRLLAPLLVGAAAGGLIVAVINLALRVGS